VFTAPQKKLRVVLFGRVESLPTPPPVATEHDDGGEGIGAKDINGCGNVSPGPEDADDSTAGEALQRYFTTARQFATDPFFEVAADAMPSRGPYQAHMQTGHGAKWFPQFVAFF